MRRLKHFIVASLRLACWFACRLLPIKRNKIVVSSYYGRGYGDNPKYIIDRLIARNVNLKIVWLVKNDKELDSLPPNIVPCKINSFSSIFHLSTARVWIDNCRKNARVKRRNQTYIQTWHGFAFKRIEKDAENSLSSQYVCSAIRDSKNIDVIISDSTFMTSIYKNSFWYNGEVVEWGSPRNDIVVSGDSESINKVYSYYRLDSAKKIVLYAPTFRADHSIEPYALDCNALLNACEERFGEKFVLLLRLHPNIAERSSEIFTFNEKIIDATFYPDMQELLVASQVVITDYSSLMFDFALSGKPCFRFAVDVDAYKADRNFYFPIDQLPFDLCENNLQLSNSIKEFNENEYSLRLNSFYESVGMIRDGKASERCADFILDILK